MRSLRLFAIIFAAVFLISVSCENTPSPSSPPPSENDTSGEQAQVQVGYAEVSIQSRNFVPDSITVSVGSTVNWISKDGEVHTVSSDGGPFNGTVDAFGNFSYTFNQAGDYSYGCSIHGQMGMNGVVHVK